MKNLIGICSVILMSVLLAAGGWAEEINAPPLVISTTPASGAVNVDPGLPELSVTFSKPMRDGSWSWVKESDDSFPVIAAKPHYLEDQRTCVVSVKLEPGKKYRIWINSEKFQNFKDAEGNPAAPYLWVFETAAQ